MSSIKTLCLLLQPSVGFHSTPSLLRGTKNLDWLRRTTSRLERNASAPRAPVFPTEPIHGRKRARAFFDIGLGESESSQKEGGSNSNSGGNSNSSSSSSSSSSLPTKTGSGGESKGVSERVVFELADDIVPISSENFLRLCERPQGAGYVGSELFKVQKGFAIFGGDFELNSGRGGRCAVGTSDGEREGERFFPDENFIGRHSLPGVLGMGNSGVHTNSSIFYVTLTECPHLDGRNVAIGRVILGLDVLRRISNAFCVDFKPASPLVIHSCGRVIEGSAEWKKIDDQIKSEEKKTASSSSSTAASSSSAASASTASTGSASNKKSSLPSKSTTSPPQATSTEASSKKLK